MKDYKITECEDFSAMDTPLFGMYIGVTSAYKDIDIIRFDIHKKTVQVDKEYLKSAGKDGVYKDMSELNKAMQSVVDYARERAKDGDESDSDNEDAVKVELLDQDELESYKSDHGIMLTVLQDGERLNTGIYDADDNKVLLSKVCMNAMARSELAANVFLYADKKYTSTVFDAMEAYFKEHESDRDPIAELSDLLTIFGIDNDGEGDDE